VSDTNGANNPSNPSSGADHQNDPGVSVNVTVGGSVNYGADTQKCDAQKQRNKHDRFDWINLIILSLTFTAAAVAAAGAWRLADLTLQALKEQNREFAVLNKASVSLQAVNWIRFKSNNAEKRWALEEIWKNSGRTQTKDFHTQVTAASTAQPFPSGFSRCTTDVQEVRVPIGGESTSSSLGPEVTAQIHRFQSGDQPFFYIWGRSEYEDAITHEPHKTRFCWQVLSVYGSPDDPSANITSVHSLCGEGNCIDDECDEEDRALYAIPNTSNACRINITGQAQPVASPVQPAPQPK
jgi:hypothetical protein